MEIIELNWSRRSSSWIEEHKWNFSKYRCANFDFSFQRLITLIIPKQRARVRKQNCKILDLQEWTSDFWTEMVNRSTMTQFYMRNCFLFMLGIKIANFFAPKMQFVTGCRCSLNLFWIAHKSLIINNFVLSPYQMKARKYKRYWISMSVRLFYVRRNYSMPRIADKEFNSRASHFHHTNSWTDLSYQLILW